MIYGCCSEVSERRAIEDVSRMVGVDALVVCFGFGAMVCFEVVGIRGLWQLGQIFG